MQHQIRAIRYEAVIYLASEYGIRGAVDLLRGIHPRAAEIVTMHNEHAVSVTVSGLRYIDANYCFNVVVRRQGMRLFDHRLTRLRSA